MFAAAACSRTADNAPAPAAADHAQAASTAQTTSSVADASSADKPSTEAERIVAYEAAEPVQGGKSVGHTSLVFRLKLENGLEAAYKPRSRKALGTTRYKGEIAAYRLAIALGLSNVPVAIPRTFSAQKVRASLVDPSAWDREALPLEGGKVPGALLPWIPKERYTPFEITNEPDFTRWRTWLMERGSVIPESAVLDRQTVHARLVAAQLGTLILFDYLTANWDRWSGGNLGLDRTTETVLYVDNDGAFYETPSVASMAEQLDAIQKMHRFSRSFVGKLRDLDEAKLTAAIGDETPGAPLLSAKVIAGVIERRKKLLGVLDAKIAADGKESVLYFD